MPADGREELHPSTRPQEETAAADGAPAPGRDTRAELSQEAARAAGLPGAGPTDVRGLEEEASPLPNAQAATAAAAPAVEGAPEKVEQEAALAVFHIELSRLVHKHKLACVQVTFALKVPEGYLTGGSLCGPRDVPVMERLEALVAVREEMRRNLEAWGA